MTRADLALLVLLLAGLGTAYLGLWASPEPARSLEIVSAGVSVGLLDLQSDHDFEAAGALGMSRIEVRDGAARFVESPCRHKICIRAGWQRRSGAVAACVPNRIAIVLSGTPDLDGMSW